MIPRSDLLVIALILAYLVASIALPLVAIAGATSGQLVSLTQAQSTVGVLMAGAFGIGVGQQRQ